MILSEGKTIKKTKLTFGKGIKEILYEQIAENIALQEAVEQLKKHNKQIL